MKMERERFREDDLTPLQELGGGILIIVGFALFFWLIMGLPDS